MMVATDYGNGFRQRIITTDYSNGLLTTDLGNGLNGLRVERIEEVDDTVIIHRFGRKWKNSPVGRRLPTGQGSNTSYQSTSDQASGRLMAG
jgi:hypothetical protein